MFSEKNNLTSENAQGYKIPHEDIYELAKAPYAPVFKMDSQGKYALLLHRKPYTDLSELMRDELKLAGLRIDPIRNISPREIGYHHLSGIDIETDEEFNIKDLPENGRFTKITWNYSQDKAAFFQVTTSGVELWYIDMQVRHAKQLTKAIVNVNMGMGPIWMKNDEILYCQVPTNRPPLKLKSSVIPLGPIISESDGRAAENRTYQDLLKDEIDKYNLEVLLESEVWKINLLGQNQIWKPKAMHSGISVSPDGNYVMVTQIEKPFSYLVQIDRFPSITQIFTCDGNHAVLINESPLDEYLPQGFMAVSKGRRWLHWRADQPSSLCWAEALDEGDPVMEVSHRDAIYSKSFPGDEAPVLLYKTQNRFAGINYTTSHFVLIYEKWWATRNQKTILLDEKLQKGYLIEDRDFQDRYSDPGSPILVKNSFMHPAVLMEDDAYIYLCGDGYQPDGQRPFIDKLHFATNIKERLFEAPNTTFKEEIMGVLNIKEGNIYSLIQSQTNYPNFYIRNIYTGSLKQLRHFENPFKKLDGVHKRILKYKRADGVDLHAVLYLPPNYDVEKKEKLPMIMWAYPTEYKSRDTAGQNLHHEHDFIYPHWSTPLYWVLRGYAILDDVSFPIIGTGEEEPNETFTEQLVENAKAAIDHVYDLGFIDKARVAIGGHSYGAFMVAMLLTHSDLFAAGIARSGAYNRTLTPFGFQSEERNLWQAKHVYLQMNPFLDADKMKSPLLLIHGESDNNSGTYTMQSERYYAALKANGAQARLVILPLESHGYVAEESIMHVLWEQDNWLENNVKNKNFSSCN